MTLSQTPSARSKRKRRLIAQEFVNELRSNTACQYCGAQPIEYHSFAHDSDPYRRIYKMVGAGKPVSKILEEINQCEAVCRKCHMSIDRRAERSVRPPRMPPSLKPCTRCQREVYRLVKELCSRCYDNDRYANRKRGPKRDS